MGPKEKKMSPDILKGKDKCVIWVYVKIVSNSLKLKFVIFFKL